MAWKKSAGMFWDMHRADSSEMDPKSCYSGSVLNWRYERDNPSLKPAAIYKCQSL